MKVQHSVNPVCGTLDDSMRQISGIEIPRKRRAYNIYDTVQPQESSFVVRCSRAQVVFEMAIVEGNSESSDRHEMESAEIYKVP